MANKLITQLSAIAQLVDSDVFPVANDTGTYKVPRATLFADPVPLITALETAHDYGNVSGSITHDIDAFGNNAVLTLTGDTTINVPTATLTGEQAVGGAMRIAGGDSYNITWSASFDWGSGGAPAAAADIIVVFYRRNGDSLTIARKVP